MSEQNLFNRRNFLLGLAGFSGSLVASQILQDKALAAMRVSGAGASFPAPLYQRWFVEYNKINKDVEVSYQSVGSGSGVKQFMQKTVDFGASDVAMTDDEIAKVDSGVILLPMTAGSVVVAYNMPGVKLKLSQQQIIDVFMGKINNWKQLGGSDQAVKVIHRSDGSGTTAVFTKYLSALSPQWRSSVGEGKSVQWPTGIGAKGNEGVTAQIKQNKGAIGYIEYGYAKNNGLTTAALQNKAGNYVDATLDNATKTLSQIQLPSNLRAFIANPDGATSYPIVTYTWIMAYKKYQDANKAKVLKEVLKWCLEKGQQYSADLGYIPLPSNVVTKVLQAVNNIS